MQYAVQAPDRLRAMHALPIADVYRILETSPHGLSQTEAAQRLQQYGHNRIHEAKGPSLLLKCLANFTHLMALLLWLGGAIAILAHLLQLGVAIWLVNLLNGAFSFWQEFKAEQATEALRRLLPVSANVRRAGEVHPIPAEDLVPGDVLVLAEGVRIPADCRVVHASELRVDQSTLTGEAHPVHKTAEVMPQTDVAHTELPNLVFAGTHVVAGTGEAVVWATGMQTAFGQIAHLTQSLGEGLSLLQQEIAHVTKVVSGVAVGVGLGVFTLATLLGSMPLAEGFIFALGMIVAFVPEGLLPTVTLALAMGVQRMACRHALVKRLSAVETLGCTTVICTDKTGTLTQNRMTVRQLFLGEILTWRAADQRQQYFATRYRPFFLAARLCHSLREGNHQGQTTYLGDPMEIALVEMAQGVLGNAAAYHLVDEIPFDASRMRLSTLYDTPDGLTLYVKGAPEALVPLCTASLMDGTVQPLDSDQRQHLRAAQDAMAAQGLRVLALAYRTLAPEECQAEAEQDLIFTGLVGLEDPPRPEVPEAIRKCQAAGVKVIMLTGDHPGTAQAIARQIGLIQSNSPVVITGERLRGVSNAQLRLALDTPEILFARLGADQKMSIVQALQQKGHVVAVTGDGVNDAPALKSAHIGIAMGLTGTDVAREAADMVLLDDNFASIVNAIEEGRAVFDNIRKFLTYILTHNVAELMPYLAFALGNIPLPLTPLQILAVDMGTDSLTALGLGVEEPDPQVMARPPRLPTERLLNWSLALRAYVFLGLIEATGAMAAFFVVLYQGGWTFGLRLAPTDPLYVQATTACLSGIIVMQIVNVFLCRSDRRSMLRTGLGGNQLILWGVALEGALLVLIVYTPYGNVILGTAPLRTDVWWFLLPCAVSMILLEEGRKWISRRRLPDDSFICLEERSVHAP